VSASPPPLRFGLLRESADDRFRRLRDFRRAMSLSP
jgi:hypothetical protein